MPGGIPPVDLMYYVPVFCMSKTARSVCGPKKSDGAREEKSGRDKVALSGGVFQNRLLLRLTEEQLAQEGFTVLRHRMIPPNDGGIAIGQAAYGMYQLQNNRRI